MKVNKCGHKRTAKVFQFEDVLPVMIFATLLCKKSKRGIINRKQLLLSNFNFTIVTYRSQNSSGFLLHYNTYYGRTDTEDHSGDDNVDVVVGVRFRGSSVLPSSSIQDQLIFDSFRKKKPVDISSRFLPISSIRFHFKRKMIYCKLEIIRV